jgi:hypothetical protein
MRRDSHTKAQRHGGTKMNEGKYFFLCALVPWCEVLLQNEERGMRNEKLGMKREK